MTFPKMLFLFIVVASPFAQASNHAKVDADMETYEKEAAQLRYKYDLLPKDPLNVERVKQHIAIMVEIDQHLRNFANEIVVQHQYTAEESKELALRLLPRYETIDRKNTEDLKSLLLFYEWFTISQFGEKTDRNAWLLVQHADLDFAFQKQVLAILEKLYLRKETDSKNFAYLFDRVAVSYNDPSQRQLQRYGTQGHCEASSRWRPLPIEDPKNLDQRRAQVGLEPHAKYVALMNQFCH